MILIVDDDRDIREALGEALEDQGWLPLAAPSGPAALQVLREHVLLPDVVLVDLMMPVMDGYDFVDAVRDDPRLARVPIIVVTASHGVDRARLGTETYVMTKPVGLAHLVSALDTIVLGISADLPQPGSKGSDASGTMDVQLQFASTENAVAQFRLQSDGRLEVHGEVAAGSKEPSGERDPT